MFMSRKKIDDVNTTPGLVNLGPIPSQSPVAAFNEFQHESLINTKGLKVLHYRHALPSGKHVLNGPHDINTQETSHRKFRYYSPRMVHLVPTRFTLEERLMAQGIVKQGSILMNIAGRYADTVPEKDDVVYVRINDLIVFPTLTEMTEQNFEYNPNAPQRLNNKVMGVDILFDNDREYTEGVDFNIVNHMIEWVDGRQPKKGSILSCVLYVTPFYVISSLLHHLRVIPANASGHAGLPRSAIYAPQQFIAVPSHIMEEDNILKYDDLPPYPNWSENNTSGGSW
jgi:hypothetical protein